MTCLTFVSIAQVTVIHFHILIIHAYSSETGEFTCLAR